jgi:hypothetical protein
MKTIPKTAKLALAIFLLGCVAHGQTKHDLTLKVSDDTGQPLAGAQAMIKFLKIGGADVNSGLTNEKGEFNARTEMAFGTFLKAEKEGNYMAQVDNTGDFFFYIPQGAAKVPLVLPRILRPIPLHVLRLDYLQLPTQGEWLGYDLETGDWVPPHGKGKTADLRFKFKNEFRGWTLDEKKMASARQANRNVSEDEIRFFYGKWRGALEVSFPRENEGVITEAERYCFYGQLRLPHLAPETGYVPSLRYDSEIGVPDGNKKPNQVGYYLRTRVKLDANGNIISANYAKIYDEIRFDARGTVSFWYYYNPTPNDRNLEFDPARNLFPQSMKGANVANP